MRFLLALIMPALIATPAFAKAKANKSAKKAAVRVSKFSGELLSYRQLMKLSKPKRMKYIKDTVELLATMESFNNRYTTAELDRMRQMKEQFAYLMQLVQFMPEAKADEYDDVQPPVDYSKIVPSHNGFEWTCGRGVKFDYVIRACVVENPGGTTVFTPSNIDVPDGDPAGIHRCPNGTHEIAHYRPGLAACIPNANWALIPQARRDGIAKGGFLKPGYLREQSLEQQRQAILGGKPDPDQADVPAPAPGASSGPSASAPSGPGAVAGEPTAPGVEPAEPNLPAAPGGATPPATEPAAPGGAAPAAPSTAAPAAPSAPATCEPAVKTCKNMSAGDRQTAIARFRSTAKYQGEDANVCIAGGFASTYATAKKEPGTCKILRAIPLPGGRSTTLCAADEALCNPVLFCLGGSNPAAGNKFEPATFCVKATQGSDRKNSAITEACAAKYARILEQKEPMITCKVDPKLKGDAKKKAQAACAAKDKENKKIKAQVCDPAYTPEGDFKKIWDDLIAQTKKLRDVWCGNTDFAALFCRECEIVNDKIFAMNKDATNSGCAEQAPSVPAAPSTSTPPPAGPPAGAVREGEPPEENRPDGR